MRSLLPRWLRERPERRDRPFDPDWVVAPGATLRDVLRDQGVSNVREWGESHGIQWESLCGLLDGTVPIDAWVADVLESTTGVSARFWLERERHYREGLAAGKTDTTPRDG